VNRENIFRHLLDEAWKCPKSGREKNSIKETGKQEGGKAEDDIKLV